MQNLSRYHANQSALAESGRRMATAPRWRAALLKVTRFATLQDVSSSGEGVILDQLDNRRQSFMRELVRCLEYLGTFKPAGGTTLIDNDR